MRNLIVAAARALAALLVLAALVAEGQTPTQRLFTAWQAAGYPGDFPAPARIVNVRDCGALGDGVASEDGAIAAAIASLGGAPGVVFFPAGTYQLLAGINLPENTVLRGERSFNTRLRFASVYDCITIAGNPGGTYQPVISGYTIHSVVLEVADASPFQPGGYAEIQESNSPAWEASDWAAGCVGQIVRIEAASSNTLSLSTPLRLTYDAALAPRIRPITPIRHAGVENLTIERQPAGTATDRDNQSTIAFRYAAGGWVRGVEFTNDFGSAVGADYSTQIEITGCYIHDAYEVDGGGSGYGVRLEYRSGDCLVQNNIFRRMRHSMLLQAGANGNVFGYNYSREQRRTEFPSDVAADAVAHGNYPYANLFEGNICQQISIDSSHGANGPLNTYLRNRAESYGIWMTDSLADNQTFVGNETYGLYTLAAGGHYAYGNNTQNNGVQPAGTTNLVDITYYLGPTATQAPPLPAWWDIAETIPPIGLPRSRTAVKHIPAYDRYARGGVLTVGPPSLACQPTNVVVNQGHPATFSVTAYGTPAPLFQWRKDGTPLAGGTNAALVVPADDLSEAGVYSVLISDSGGSVLSADATLTLMPVYHTLIVSAGDHGSIMPSGTVTVIHGGSTNFALMPQPHYHVEALTVDGCAATPRPETSWTYSRVTNSGTVAATFALDTCTLTVNSAWGTPAPGSLTANWNTPITASVDSPVTNGSSTQYVCVGWTGTGDATNGIGTETSFVMTTNTTLSWQWTTNYWLTSAVHGGGTVSLASGWYAKDGLLEVAATPTGAYAFVQWTGRGLAASDLTNNPLWFAMDRAYAITAYFQREPLVRLTTPDEGRLYRPGARITIAADAQDAHGVERVEFYQGSILVGESLSPPYRCLWPRVPVGAYTVTARAWDVVGNVSTSAPVNITVTRDAAPPALSWLTLLLGP